MFETIFDENMGFGLRATAPSGGEGYEEVAFSNLDMADFFTSAKASISRVASLKDSIKPDEFEIKMSLAAEVQSGKLVAVLVDGKAEGGIEVTLKWAGKDVAS